MLRKQILKLDDFSGGLITKGSEIAIQKNQSSDCVNVFSDLFKSLQKRNGYAKLNSSTAGGAAKGVYNFRQSDTVQYLVGLWNTTLKKMDVVANAWDGTWDTITQSATHGTALTANFMYNTTYEDDCIITTEGRDVPQKYNPSDDANYTDLDWETSHCYVVGDVTTVTPNPLVTKSYLKITIDGTAFDDVVLDADTSIADVVTSINAHTGLAAKGFACVDSSGYLRIYSNTRGSAGSVAVEDGSNDNQEATEILFDGTSQTGTTITSNIAPSAKYCATWQFYTWLANTLTNPDRIYYSGADDPTSWSATDYQDIITPGDVGLTGVVVLGESMYVFKKYSIHRVSYLGGLPLFKFVQATNMGTSSPRSIQVVEIPGQRTSIIFLGTDMQMYKFDGYNITPLSEAISTYNGISTYCMVGDAATYGINYQQLNLAHAVNYIFRHWYILFFCKDNDTTPKDAIVFDYFSNTFWPFHFDQDGSDVFNASCIADNGYGQQKCYVSGTDGTNYYTWLFDSGNTDDSGNIDAYWTSARLDFGSEVQAKALRLIHFTTKSVACTPTYQYRTDWGSTWSDAETLVTATTEHVYDVPRFEELYQIKLQDDSTSAAFNFIRASVVTKVSGVAK